MDGGGKLANGCDAHTVFCLFMVAVSTQDDFLFTFLSSTILSSSNVLGL
jgi:hypothetical protein